MVQEQYFRLEEQLMVQALTIRITLATSLLFFSGFAKTHAEDYVLDELYSSGVHAFFDQDYVHAIDLFTSALAEGSRDPRIYYFRGLANLAKGSKQAADGDFQTGAKFEVSKTGAFRIGKSLERVQGSNRLKLEKFRQEARTQARREQIQRDRLRYHTLEDAGSRVPSSGKSKNNTVPEVVNDPFTDETADRPVGTGPAEETAGPQRTTAEPANTEDEEIEEFSLEEDPFGGEPELDEPKDLLAPEIGEDDPFAEDEADDEAAADDEDDPFAEDEADDEAAADDEDDLFAEDEADDEAAADDEDDLFAEDEADDEAAADDEDDPFAEDEADDEAAADDEDDPFAEDEADDEAAADDEDDPFAEDEADDEAAADDEDDPFAEDEADDEAAADDEDDPFAEDEADDDDNPFDNE